MLHERLLSVFGFSAEDGFDQVLWYFQRSETNWGGWAMGGLPIGGVLHAGDLNQSFNITQNYIV